jgi:hypothetical protein
MCYQIEINFIWVTLDIMSQNVDWDTGPKEERHLVIRKAVLQDAKKRAEHLQDQCKEISRGSPSTAPTPPLFPSPVPSCMLGPSTQWPPK